MELRLPKAWGRDWDVYSRAQEVGIDFRAKEEVVRAPKGRRICSVTFTPSGLVFTSGAGGGRGAVTNDDESVEEGFKAGRQAGWLSESDAAAIEKMLRKKK